MICRSCGDENPDGALFCGGCGASLVAVAECSRCGAKNPTGKKFCNACGQALSGAASTAGEGQGTPGGGGPTIGRDPHANTPEHLAEKIRAGRGGLEGERKQVTVLFADVIGSMELAEESDPEEWRRIMDRFSCAARWGSTSPCAWD